MPIFRNKQDLRQSIADAGLAALSDRIVATAKPAIMFVRQQQADDGLPPGTSKIGGLPDLPPGFGWPERAARGDAPAWERSVRETQGAQLDMRDYGVADEVAGQQEARQAAYARLLIESFPRPFPLAFRAQLDLEALSVEPGFDPDLPTRGFLYVFEDATGSGGGEDTCLFWSDCAAGALTRHAMPPDLVALSEAHAYGEPWEGLVHAEVLHPVSALSIPYHWVEAGEGSRSALFDLMNEPSIPFYPDVPGHTYFGDQLGGWPQPVQHDPELALLGPSAAPLVPGDDRVSHVFSWGGEHHAGTRLVSSDTGGDGLTYVLVNRQALLNRRFSEATGVYQTD